MRVLFILIIVLSPVVRAATIEKTFIWDWEFTANGGTNPGALVGGSVEVRLVQDFGDIERTLFDFELLVEHGGDLVSMLQANRKDYLFRPWTILDVWYIPRENTLQPNAERLPLWLPSEELSMILGIESTKGQEDRIFGAHASHRFWWGVDHCPTLPIGSSAPSVRNVGPANGFGRALSINLNNFHPEKGWGRCEVFAYHDDKPLHFTLEGVDTENGSFRISNSEEICADTIPAQISISRPGPESIEVRYSGTLEHSLSPTGPFSAIVDAANPFVIEVGESPQMFFRAR